MLPRVLIPAFHKAGAKLHTLVTANGINSVIHGKKAGFLNASTDVDAMLKKLSGQRCSDCNSAQ